MLMPSIFGESLLDDFFEDPFDNYAYAMNTSNLMKTDVKDTDQGYEITMNLPGVKKEDVKAELKDGYLTITADRKEPVEKADERTRYVRKERYYGTMKRTFYVGEDITENEIHAAFKDGILKVIIDKPQPKKIEDGKTIIPIEG